MTALCQHQRMTTRRSGVRSLPASVALGRAAGTTKTRSRGAVTVPNLPNRYEYSQRKDADEERPEVTVVHVKSEKVECLGGCGEMVAPGHKCVACATAAVHE